MTYRAAPSHLHRDRVPWTAHGSALSAFQTHQLYLPEAAEVAGDDVGFTVAGAVAGPRFCVGDRAAADGSTLRAEPFFQTHQPNQPEAMEIAGDDVDLAVAEAAADGLPPRAEPFFQTHQLYLSEAMEVTGDDAGLAVAGAVAGPRFCAGGSCGRFTASRRAAGAGTGCRGWFTALR